MEESESHKLPLDNKIDGIISSLHIDCIFGFDRSSRCQDVACFKLKMALESFRKTGELRRELKRGTLSE